MMPRPLAAGTGRATFLYFQIDYKASALVVQSVVLYSLLASALATDTTIEPSRAGINPVTVKPSIKEAANQKISAFRTRAKSPKVIIVKGSVRIKRIGLMTKFRRPNIKAAIMAI